MTEIFINFFIASPIPMVTDDDDNSKMSDGGDGDRGGSGSVFIFPRYATLLFPWQCFSARSL